MWTFALRRFWRDERGATLIVASVSMPVLFLAFAVAIEITGAAEYRQRLLTTAELTCRHVTLYLNRQASIPNRDPATDLQVFEAMTIAHTRALGVASDPMPFTIAIRNGRPEMELQGRYPFIMFDLSALGVIVPSGPFPCRPLAEAPGASGWETSHV